MKSIFTILALATLALCSMHKAQAQNYTTFTILAHYDNNMALTVITSWDGLTFDTLRTNEDDRANQRFIIEQQANGTALIRCVADPTLCIRRNDAYNDVDLATPSADGSDLAHFEWVLDFAGKDENDKGLCFIADPNDLFTSLRMKSDGEAHLHTRNNPFGANNTKQKDKQRFRVIMTSNTF